MRIYMDKSEHQYYKDGKNYMSVSAVMDKYQNEYNSQYWSLYKAFELYLTKELISQNPKFATLAETTMSKKAKKIINEAIDIFYIQGDGYKAKKAEDEEALRFAIFNSSASEDDIEQCLQEIKEQWDNKRDSANLKGNSYHRSREIQAIKNGFEINAYDNKSYPVHLELLAGTFDKTGVSHEDIILRGIDFSDRKYTVCENLMDLPDGFYPELIIWNDEYQVAGQADRVFIETVFGDRYVDIDDYKTNKVLKRTSYYVRGKGHQMMKPPIQHLMDCKHVRYNLQVSMYAYFLEAMGFKVRQVGYHHLNVLNKLDYLRDEVINVLNDLRYKDTFNGVSFLDFTKV
jgi:hypothetical protein